MQIEVEGYILGDSLYEFDELVTYRARHVVSDEQFLARAPRSEFPAIADVNRLQRELDLLSTGGAELASVMRPLHRVDANHNTFLIYEANAGIPLDQFTKNQALPIEQALLVARALLTALAGCHERGVLHCCISPKTVLWDCETHRVTLTHFVHGRRISEQDNESTNAPLSGFSAPEQSRQLTAGIAQATDLYAAGAVIYWLLTGAEPVLAARGSDLMHELVARKPIELGLLREGIPPHVAELVHGLLAKSPGDRPQSAVEALELLGRQGNEVGTLAAPSIRPPAQLGWPSLHGRDNELATLREAVAHAAAGALRVVFIGGAPGSGKSRLTEELRYSLPRDRYLLASGKFEQYRQTRPYSALVSAMAELFDRFLGYPEDGLSYWRERFVGVDANLRAVLVDQIPQLQYIVGDHKPPPKLGPTETQNRFHLAFRALLEALCAREHPLVLIVDDLHWSDEGTLALLSDSFIASGTAHLVLVLAYRPKEAGSAPRVAEFIQQQLDRADVSRRIELEQLTAIDMAALCSDIVSPCPQSAELCRRVQNDSHGNPLFALEVIKHLRQTGGLRKVVGSQGAAWHFEPVARPTAAPENVVDFIVSRIDALPHASRRAVVAASCLGHSFEARLLALALGMSPEQLRDALSLPAAEDMILAGGPEATAWISRRVPAAPLEADVVFTFYHDRIQQAAYSLCGDQEQRRLRLVIGRELAWGSGENPVRFFSAVEHLNHVDAELEPAERERLAVLNLTAGRAAKDIIAYGTATGLFEKALRLLEASDHSRRFEVLLELAESRYLSASFDAAEEAFRAALEEARSVEQQVLVHRTQLVLYQHQQRYEEAIALGLRALRLLGTNHPLEPSRPRLAASLALTMIRVGRRDLESLGSAPDSASDLDRLALDLLVLLWTPCFWTNQKLCGLVVLDLMERTMKLGNTAQAPMAYACFAILNHVLLKRYETALEFGRLAVKLLGPETAPFIASRVRFLTLTFFGALQRDNRVNVEAYEQALASCLSSGEHVFAGHTIDGITTSLPIHGFRLPEVERRLEACRVIAERISSEPSLELISVIRGWCRALIDGPELAVGPAVADLRFDSYVGVHLMLQMATRYLWDDDDGVIELMGTLRENVVIQSNPLHAGFYALFAALSLCRRAPGKGRRRIRALIARVARFERIFSGNFRSSLLLLQAEAGRHAGDATAALELYHRAISEASQRGHDLVHGIACERLAGLYEARGDAQGSREYLKVAAHSFGRFGAAAKVGRLASRNPGHSLNDEQGNHATQRPGQPVDLRAEAVMRAAYAIAEETRSDRLGDTLLSVVTTAAGAQRAFLLKPDGLKWLTVASWSNDLDGGAKVRAAGSPHFSEATVRYAARTKSTVHVHDARDPRFIDDTYFRANLPRSVLCVPLLHRGSLLAVLYMENSICADVFTHEQQQLATMLGHQAAIAMAIADYHRVQIDALQAKINPHFLHNALSVIAGLVVTKPELAESAIVKLSKLYRYVLNASAGQLVSLDQELAITKDYLALEACRFEDRLKVELNVSGATGQVEIPALVLQPLVENAVRYGVARSENGGTVRIDVAVDAYECRLRVADDGPGWFEGKGGSGFGLKSVIDRLKLRYGDGFEIVIDKGPGVSVGVRFALKPIPSEPGRVSASANRLGLP